MIDFPFSLLLLPLAVAAGVGYVKLGNVSSVRWRGAGRAALLTATWAAPLATRGPGPAQLILGLLLGFLGIRMVALGTRWPDPRSLPAPGWIAATLITPEPLLVRRRHPVTRPALTVARGLLASAACLGLLIVGNRIHLWQWSRFADDMLVFVEVAVGATGIHHLIVGIAALGGRQVRGLQDQPHFSSSLSQFWARRWNHLVQGNLDRAFFRPQARRRSFRRGTLLAFAASGIMHVVAVLDAGSLSITLGPASAVMAFFMLHAVLVLAERRSGITARSESRGALWVARVRTIVLFALLSPLLLDPFASVANVHGRSLGPSAAPGHTSAAYRNRRTATTPPASMRSTPAGTRARPSA
jgi:hypothetical protein